MLPFVEAKPVRVLHIVGDSRYGGVAQIILGLGRVSQADGWQVDVLATDPVLQDVLQREALGVVNLDVIRREIRPLWDFSGLLRLLRFLRREGYTIVHTHTSKAGFVGRLAARLAGVPVIVHTVHGFAFHEQSPVMMRRFYTRMERIAARWCDRMVSVSQFHRTWAVELGICRDSEIQAIPNGIAQPRRVQADPSALRREIGAGDEDLLILSVARLAPDKGLADLIKAVAILQAPQRNLCVAIAGDGPSRQELETLARDCGVTNTVKFLGFRHDVVELLSAADVVVLPSLREGLSISLLEAMAAGKPIIATSIGSHREVAAQAEVVQLVPPADPPALAAAIDRLTSDPSRMAHLASRARALFESCYTEDRMLKDYRQLYQNLLDQRVPVRANGSSGHEPVIRLAAAGDLPGIVRIHQTAFKQFFVTQLGERCLRLYYELVVNYHAGIMLVSETHGVLTGFVCGFLDPGDFYRLMWGKRRAFALPALAALFRHPYLAANIFRAIRRIQTSALQGPPKSCELSSIAVAPEACGNGLGKSLLKEFLKQSWSMDAQSVFLTTDADANEKANAMYREVGFERSRCFMQRKGRWMNEYVFHRDVSDEAERTLV